LSDSNYVKWRDLPTEARRYILFQTFFSPLVFTWYLIPYLMLIQGIEVIEVGLIFTLSSLASAFVNVLVGRLLESFTLNYLIFANCFIYSIALIVYCIGFLYQNVWFILLASIVDDISDIFSPSYLMYEYLAYPEKSRERIYLYHNIVPHISVILTYPLIGYILSISTHELMVYSLIFFALATLMLSLISLKWLPKVKSSQPRNENFRVVTCKTAKSNILFILTLVILTNLALSLTPIFIITNLFYEIFGGGLFELGIYSAIYSMFSILVLSFILRIKRYSAELFIKLGLLILTLSNVLIYLSRDLSHLFLASILLSIGLNVFQPTYKSILFSRIPTKHRGILLGLISGLDDLIDIASPIIAGLIASFNPRAPFIVVAILFSLTLLFLKIF